MDCFIEFLKEWQTLIGAVLGGVFALLVALLVAYKMRRHDETTSAMILIPDLLHLYAAKTTIEEAADNNGIEPDKRDLWMVAQLVRARPVLSPLYQVSMAKIMPVNPSLAAHLSFIEKIYPIVVSRIPEVEKNLDSYKTTKKYLVEEERFLSLVSSVANDMKLVSMHAVCANNLIAKLVTSKIALLNRITYFLFKTKKSEECEKLLATGNV